MGGTPTITRTRRMSAQHEPDRSMITPASQLRRPSASELDSSSTVPSAPARPARRSSLSTMNVSRPSSAASNHEPAAAASTEISRTPSLPRFMADTRASMKRRSITPANSSAIPAPLRVVPSRSRAATPLDSTRGRSTRSIGSLNDLSFSSGRTEGGRPRIAAAAASAPAAPVAARLVSRKRAESSSTLAGIDNGMKKGRIETRGGDVVAPKRPRMEIVSENERREEEMENEEAQTAFYLQPAAHTTAAAVAASNQQDETLTESVSVQEVAKAAGEDASVDPGRRVVTPIKRGLDILMERFSCVRDAVATSRKRRMGEGSA